MMTTPKARKILCLLGVAAVFLLAGCRGAPYYNTEYTASLGGFRATAENAVPNDAFVTVTGPNGMQAAGLLRDVTVDQIALGRTDRKLYLFALSKSGKNSVHVYEVNRKVFTLVWQGVPSSLKPWKIILGDVDGDGKLDLGVGVYKKAKFHPVMARRPFVYTWNGKSFEPKWLGSRLSRPFTDFAFAEFADGPKLVSIEDTRDGRHELAVYKWDGFGFTRVWTGCRAKEMSDLQVSGQVISVKSDRSDVSDKSDRTYTWNGKELKEVRR